MLNAFRLSSKKPFGYEIFLRNLLTEVWLTIYQQVETSKGKTKANLQKNDEKVKLMVTFIYEHFDEEISVADIAKAAFVSERECFRLFKTLLNTTPLTYLKNFRIHKACELLCHHHQCSVSEIAFQCGFQNPSYFSQVFKNLLDLSPSEYRNKLAGF